MAKKDTKDEVVEEEVVEETPEVDVVALAAARNNAF